MTKTQSQYITIGKIGRPFGVKGWCKIISFTAPVENILLYQPWHLERKGDWSALVIEDSRWHKDELVAKLAGIETPEQARLFTNLAIGVAREKLPPANDDEFYWMDLEGLTVITTTGVVLGTLSYLVDTGANPIMFVKGDRERVLPYLPNQVVKKIDLAKGEMIVEWDETF